MHLSRGRNSSYQKAEKYIRMHSLVFQRYFIMVKNNDNDDKLT